MTLDLEETLRFRFGLSSFRAGQLPIIEGVLRGKDVLAVLPTGGGKSLCYQLPAVHKNQWVIVITPLISLMKDQVHHLLHRGLRAGTINSGQSHIDKRNVFEQLDPKQHYVLYLSPERVQKEGFHQWIKDKPIGLFAIDEAHCISQWGHDFRDDYSKLALLKELRPDVPILALTASATPTVLTDIANQLKLSKPEKHIYGFYRPNLFYQVAECDNDQDKLDLILGGLRGNPSGRVIIYCGTRKTTEELAEALKKEFKDVAPYHAGLSSEIRTQTQELYQKGGLRILVATNAFGMGIDQPDVRLVIHYHIPSTIDALYQEMGRAGRDQKDSTCLLLYQKKDKGLQAFFIEKSEAPEKIKKSKWNNLNALIDYAEGGSCRHSEILNYFRDTQRIKKCGHCDVCAPQSDRNVRYRALKKSFLQTLKPLDAVSDHIFQHLKIWRELKASQLDTALFMVASDRMLRDMAEMQPQRPDQFRKIKGFGDSRIEKFSWEIMGEIKKAKATN